MYLPIFYTKPTKHGTTQYSAVWYKLGVFFQKSSDGTWTFQNDPVKFLDLRKHSDDRGASWSLFVGPYCAQFTWVN